MNTTLLCIVIGELIRKCYPHPVLAIYEILLDVLFNEACDQAGILETPNFLRKDKLNAYHIAEIYIEADAAIEQLLNDLREKRLGCEWNTLAFTPDIKTLTITRNTDTYGQLKLPVEDFTCTITNPTGITLRDVTEGVYRLKGSKHDYEMYGGINTVCNHVYIKVDFSYGS